jgi:hypothetical protein
LRQGRSRGRPPFPVCTGSRKVSRMARMEEHNPSVQTYHLKNLGLKASALVCCDDRGTLA